MYAALARTLRWASIIISLVIVASFSMFALDQVNGASKQQQSEIASGTWQPPATVAQHHSGVRREIDSADNKLTTPFHGLTAGSHSLWVINGVQTALALLLFGLGLAWAARLLRMHA